MVVLVLDTALQIVRTSAIARRMFRLPENCENFHLSQRTVPDHFPSLVKFCDRTLRLRETVEDQIRHGCPSMSDTRHAAACHQKVKFVLVAPNR